MLFSFATKEMQFVVKFILFTKMALLKNGTLKTKQKKILSKTFLLEHLEGWLLFLDSDMVKKLCQQL